MTYAAMMIEKYRSKGLLLDANLLLLYLVGTVDRSLVDVGHYNKLSDFRIEEIIHLGKLIAYFTRVMTTAHVLTEVSNLVGDLHEEGRRRSFRSFAETLEVIEEQDIPSYQVARRKEFEYLGLTDSVLAELAGKFLVVSKDGRMVGLLRDKGIDALRWVEVLGLSA